MPNDDALHAEIRRLRSALRRAEEDADQLRQQLAYANEQVRRLRAKIPTRLRQAAPPQ